MTREQVVLFAENVRNFVQYVEKSYKRKNKHLSNLDKLFRLKMLTEEYKLKLYANELIRVNKFGYDEKTSNILVSRIEEALKIIDEYVSNNVDDLFIFTARTSVLTWKMKND